LTTRTTAGSQHCSRTLRYKSCSSCCGRNKFQARAINAVTSNRKAGCGEVFTWRCPRTLSPSSYLWLQLPHLRSKWC